jgi:hypothetical protein
MVARIWSGPEDRPEDRSEDESRGGSESQRSYWVFFKQKDFHVSMRHLSILGRLGPGGSEVWMRCIAGVRGLDTTGVRSIAWAIGYPAYEATSLYRTFIFLAELLTMNTPIPYFVRVGTRRFLFSIVHDFVASIFLISKATVCFIVKKRSGTCNALLYLKTCMLPVPTITSGSWNDDVACEHVWESSFFGPSIHPSKPILSFANRATCSVCLPRSSQML